MTDNFNSEKQSRLHTILKNDAHIRCADFGKARAGTCCCCNDTLLYVFRWIFFIPMAAIAILNTYGDWHGSIYYESEWGFILTTFSIFCTLMAHHSKWFHSAAVYTSEISMGFNIIITPIFWLVLMPIFINAAMHPPKNAPVPAPAPPKTVGDDHGWFDFTKTGGWVAFEMIFVHSTPIIYSSIELHCTEMVFLKRDSKWCFLAGVIYFFCNMWGTFYVLHGYPIYPIPGFKWDPAWLTVVLYLLQAPVLYGINNCVAGIVQKRRGWVDDGLHDINHFDKVDGNDVELSANTNQNQIQ